MTVNGRLISLAHLCMIEVAPIDLARAAAAAGYDSIGIRLVPTADGVDHEVLGNPSKLTEVRQMIDDTGLIVLDVEVVRVKPEGFGDVRALLEAGAQLGARHVICTVEDPDHNRRLENFTSFCELAASYGLRANLEYMVFSEAHSLSDALAIVEATGSLAAVLVDPLHHERSGGRPEDVWGISATVLPYVQLCDAQPSGPAADRLTARSEAVLGRLLPGTGDLPLRRLLDSLDPTTGISVECPLAGQRRPVDPTAWAIEAMARTREVLTP
jgi:sugar phosphate isomerase/epimerase